MGRLPRRGRRSTNGITAKISSWQRVGPNVIPHVAKATGVYLNSMLATTEAQRAGYDEGILLTADGYVADGPGENIFVVKNGVILTPPLVDLDPARDHARHGDPDRAGSRLRRRGGALIRSDLYLADEVFMTGTAAEVTPVRSVDDHEIGVGPVTREIQGRTSTPSTAGATAGRTGSTSSTPCPPSA